MIYLYTLIGIIVLSLVLSIIFKDSKKLYRLFFVSISFTALTVISAIRWNVGCDFPNYYSLYLRVLNNDLWNLISTVHYEAGYVILNVIAAFFNQDSQSIFILTSIIIQLFVGISIYKYSKMPLMSTIVYMCLNFYTGSLNTIRQYIATGFVLISIGLIKDRKLFKFIIMMVIASFFHKAVLIFIPFYFIANKEVNYKKLFIYIAFCLIALMFFRLVSNFFINLFYSGYSNKGENVTKLDLGLTIAVPFVISIVALVRQKKIIEIDECGKININAIIITSAIYFLTTQMILMKRFAEYFYIFAIFLIPDIISTFKKKEERILLSIIIFMMLFTYFYIITLRANLHGVIPYQTYF